MNNKIDLFIIENIKIYIISKFKIKFVNINII